MRAIYIYARCTKVTTNKEDIRPSVTVKVLYASPPVRKTTFPW